MLALNAGEVPNEDSLSASENITNLPTAPRPNGLFIVADGMGGHGNGSEASQLAIREMRERVSRLLRSGETDGETIKALLVEGVQHANQRVYERNQQQHTQYGYDHDGRSALGDLHFRGECRRQPHLSVSKVRGVYTGSPRTILSSLALWRLERFPMMRCIPIRSAMRSCVHSVTSQR